MLQPWQSRYLQWIGAAHRIHPAGRFMSRRLKVVLNMSRIALFALVVSAPLGALSAQPETAAQPAATSQTASEQQAAPEQDRARPNAEERRICRRLETTGTRTGAQRLCMTAEQWRRADD
jgi:hypothetical protein